MDKIVSLHEEQRYGYDTTEWITSIIHILLQRQFNLINRNVNWWLMKMFLEIEDCAILLLWLYHLKSYLSKQSLQHLCVVCKSSLDPVSLLNASQLELHPIHLLHLSQAPRSLPVTDEIMSNRLGQPWHPGHIVTVIEPTFNMQQVNKDKYKIKSVCVPYVPI